MEKNITKQKVVETASSLFFQKGFHGTSVRDIAQKASVNVSLISYYFNGKQGLLEYAVTNYYENYFQQLEQILQHTETKQRETILKELLYSMLEYKTEHFKWTSFIYRELSLDSTFVREVSVTYLAKENHLLKQYFAPILHATKKHQSEYLFMQLKGMIMSPFVLKNEWNHIQILDNHTKRLFIDRYMAVINDWISFICQDQVTNKV